jgi:hypothetical protein
MQEEILHKSERGQREMAAATPTLSPKMRRLLIMADGKTTVAQLARMVPGSDGMAMLNELIGMGYLELASARARSGAARTTAPAPPPSRENAQPPVSRAAPDRPSQTQPATPGMATSATATAARAAMRAPQLAVVSAAAPAYTPTPAPARDPAQSLAPVKAELRAFLAEVMGADISLVQDKLEAVQDAERLARFLTRCEDLVANYGGARKAADFRSRFSGHY